MVLTVVQDVWILTQGAMGEYIPRELFDTLLRTVLLPLNCCPVPNPGDSSSPSSSKAANR